MKKHSGFYPSLIFVTVLFLTGMISACNSSKKINNNYIYFRSGADTVSTLVKETTIQPNDVLSIQVFSRTINQEQAAIFNLPATTANTLQGYQVNLDGTINMPVIGNIKAAGLSNNQLQALLVQKLIEYVKNPAVLVRFLQFNVNVLGEVRAPGIHTFLVDRVTVIDALSSAGDLTDYGKREDVTVIREAGGKKIYYTIDLRSRELFKSPVYMLQPNDVVYVAPNKVKLKNLNVDPEAQRRTGLIFNITSVALSVGFFVMTILRLR
jgi:polysaccharide export outer membrane protein